MKVLNIIISTLFALLITTNVYAVTISASFTAVGAGGVLAVDNQDKITYAVSGTFVGTVELQRSLNGGASYQAIKTITASDSGEIAVDTPSGQPAVYRFYCRAFTSGTIVTSIVDVDTVLQSVLNRKGVSVADFKESGMKVTGAIDATDITSASYINLVPTTDIKVPGTITAALSTGNKTINKVSGTVNIAASGTGVVITDTVVTTSSLILTNTRTADATCSVKNAVPTANTITITMTAACTAETSVGFFVVNMN